MARDKDINNIPQGFILNDAGMYSYVCQDVFPDILSFITAIPGHLKPLFLIPIKIDAPASHLASDGVVHIASRLANEHIADETVLDGNTPDGDLFGTKTFVYDDLTPTVNPSVPGSIYDIDGADERTHHQDLVDNQDQNIQPDTTTTFYDDVDLTESNMGYPYRTPERPLRHSTDMSIIVPFQARIALKPYELETKTPDNIKENSDTCQVSLTSYDKKFQVFSFSVTCGGSDHTVRAKLNDLQHVAVNCTCPFWRWNGPEYHASQNNYLLGNPSGTATPPNMRDPERQFHLCKHTYAVIARLDEFVDEISQENWGLSDEEIMQEVDENWDRMEGVAEIPLDEVQENDVEAEVEDLSEDSEEEPEAEEESDETESEPGEDLPEDDDSVEEPLEEEPESDEVEEEPEVEEDEPEEDVEDESEPEEDSDLSEIAESVADDQEEESDEKK